jgi:hypothetical protein
MKYFGLLSRRKIVAFFMLVYNTPGGGGEGGEGGLAGVWLGKGWLGRVDVVVVVLQA